MSLRDANPGSLRMPTGALDRDKYSELQDRISRLELVAKNVSSDNGLLERLMALEALVASMAAPVVKRGRKAKV